MPGKHSKHLLAKEENKKYGIEVFDFQCIEFNYQIQVTEMYFNKVHLKNCNLISKNHPYIQNYSTFLFCLYTSFSDTTAPGILLPISLYTSIDIVSIKFDSIKLNGIK